MFKLSYLLSCQVGMGLGWSLNLMCCLGRPSKLGQIKAKLKGEQLTIVVFFLHRWLETELAVQVRAFYFLKSDPIGPTTLDSALRWNLHDLR